VIKNDGINSLNERRRKSSGKRGKEAIKMTKWSKRREKCIPLGNTKECRQGTQQIISFRGLERDETAGFVDV
jgi:hypothetical protein